jgi:cytoskeleton protein RodZ
MAQAPNRYTKAKVFSESKEDFSSERKLVEASQVGILLRQTREAQNFSIDDMSQKTRLRDVHLISLEAGDVEKLPGTAFVAGFMRLYAKNLGIANDPVVERFLLDFESKRQNLTADSFSSPTKPRQQPNSGAIIGGLVGLVALSVAYSQFGGMDDAGQQLPSTPPVKVGDTVPVFVENSDKESKPAKSVLHVGKPELQSLNVQWSTEVKGSSTKPEYVSKKPAEVVKKPEYVSKKPAEVVKKPVLKQKPIVVAKYRKPQPKPVVLKPKTVAVVKKPVKKVAPPRMPAPVVVKKIVRAKVRREVVKPYKPKTVKPLKRKVQRRVEDKRLNPRQRIYHRYPEPIVDKQALIPDSSKAISLISRELVWIQIQDDEGTVLKDMVMQPNHVFRVPTGGQFFAILGNAGGVRLRIGSKKLPYLGEPGEVIQDLDLSVTSLLERAAKR